MVEVQRRIPHTQQLPSGEGILPDTVESAFGDIMHESEARRAQHISVRKLRIIDEPPGFIPVHLAIVLHLDVDLNHRQGVLTGRLTTETVLNKCMSFVGQVVVVDFLECVLFI